ncbi:MAG TPA: hypothetical protein QGF58_02275 [Myxococcota bacterium]|nr:hypothetical protein [Myxococcota bacterium]
MKKLAALYISLAIGLLTFLLWSARIWPFDGHPEPEDVAWQDLRVEQDAVRVKGTAHYTLRVSQERAGRFGRPDRTWFVAPFMKPGDTSSTLIEVVVASTVEPERLVSYEDMTVEGYALPKASAMTPALEEAFKNAGYSFVDDYFVIEVFPPED